MSHPASYPPGIYAYVLQAIGSDPRIGKREYEGYIRIDEPTGHRDLVLLVRKVLRQLHHQDAALFDLSGKCDARFLAQI